MLILKTVYDVTIASYILGPTEKVAIAKEFVASYTSMCNNIANYMHIHS